MKRLWLIAAAAVFLGGTVRAADHAYTRSEDNALFTTVRKQTLLKTTNQTPLPVRSENANAQLEAPRLPRGIFLFMPYYFNSSNKEYEVTFNGVSAKQGKVRANGAGGFLVWKQFFNEHFNMDFITGHFFLTQRGKALTPKAFTQLAGISTEKSRTNQRSHTNGWILQPNIVWGKWGETKLSWLQSFDRTSGDSYFYTDNGGVVRQSHNNDGSNGTALMAWHQMPIPVGEKLRLTPFVGWRSLYVVAKQGDSSDAPSAIAEAFGQNKYGSFGTRKADDTSLWIHVGMIGLKAEYNAGRWSAFGRVSYAHRFSKDNVPAYANFATAPDVYMLGHRSFLDRDTVAVGIGAQFAITPRALLSVEYDGAFTKNTKSHLANVNFIFPF